MWFGETKGGGFLTIFQRVAHLAPCLVSDVDHGACTRDKSTNVELSTSKWQKKSPGTNFFYKIQRPLLLIRYSVTWDALWL